MTHYPNFLLFIYLFCEYVFGYYENNKECVIYIDFDRGEISNLPLLYVKFEEEKG